MEKAGERGRGGREREREREREGERWMNRESGCNEIKTSEL